MKRTLLALALFVLAGCAAVKGTTMTYTGLSAPTLVADRLYLCNRYQAVDVELLKKLGVTVRVNVASQFELSAVPDMLTVNIPIEEVDEPETWYNMALAVNRVRAYLADGETVSDNCWFGENRSALLDAIIVSLEQGISVETAWERIHIIRPETYWKEWMNGYKDTFWYLERARW